MKLLCFSLIAAHTAMAALSVTPSKDSLGRPIVILENTSETCSFSAYIVEFQSRQEQGAAWNRTMVDSVLADRHGDPIPPKSSKEIVVPKVENLNSIQAAALCGSDRAGDPKLAELLVSRRAQFRADLVTARELVRKLRAEQAAFNKIDKAFRDWRQDVLRRDPEVNRGAVNIAELRSALMRTTVHFASGLPHLVAKLFEKERTLAAVEEYLDGLESRLNALNNVASR